MPDHFSGVARAYAQFRPGYPDVLFDYLAGLAPRRDLAWDCGAGSGQATGRLAGRFARVFASDISRRLLAAATADAGIMRVVASAERSPLAGASADLVTVAQALHWLDLPAFYAEVHRVLRPGGALAVWSYGLLHFEDEGLDVAFREFHDGVVGPYWPPERRLVEDGYRGISFPFDETAAPEFSMEAHWTLDEFLGYVGTWSAVSRYRASVGSDALPLFEATLSPLWGARSRRRRLQWPLALRVGRPLAGVEAR